MYETKIDSGEGRLKHCIRVGEKTYEVPLMGDVSYDELNKILEGTEEHTPDGIVRKTPLEYYKAFLEKHLPKKVVSGLSVNQLRMIQSDWAKYSKDAMGISPGES